MRILFVSNDFSGFGGMQQHVRDFLRQAADSANIRVVMMRKGSWFKKIIFLVKVFAGVVVFRPNFIIYNHVNFSPIIVVLHFLTSIPYGVIVYGIDVWGVDNPIKQRALRRSGMIISASHFTAKKLNQELGIPLGRISVLHPTIDTNVFCPVSDTESLRLKYGLSGQKVILFVGRLSAKESYKGYDWVVRAMPQVLREIPNALYVIFGGGDDQARVEQMVQDMGLDKSVRFVGALSNDKKLDYCRAADVFIMPSTGEGFGIVYLEALACGTPAIAGNQDASPEPLLGGKIGVLINPRDVQAIAGAIIKVLRRETPPEFSDRRYLYNEVVSNFGYYAFGEQVKKIINDIKHGLQK